MNEPDREDKVIRNSDEKKVILATDSKMPNTMVFNLVKEDHTVGNLLRMSLLSIRQVRFAGYRIPHPLEHVLILKVETSDEITPLQAVNSSVDDLIKEFQDIENVFKAALDKFKRRRDRIDYQ